MFLGIQRDPCKSGGSGKGLGGSFLCGGCLPAVPIADGLSRGVADFNSECPRYLRVSGMNILRDGNIGSLGLFWHMSFLTKATASVTVCQCFTPTCMQLQLKNAVACTFKKTL